jgi:hypothetical protein
MKLQQKLAAARYPEAATLESILLESPFVSVREPPDQDEDNARRTPH